MALIIVFVFSVLISGAFPQPPLALSPAHNHRQDDSVFHDRFRRGFITDDAVEDEKVDRTQLRREEDHFANAQTDSTKFKTGHGHLGDGGLFSSGSGHQLDSQKIAMDRRKFENDHLGVRRNAASLQTGQMESGSRSGRSAYRAALGGPFKHGEIAYDEAEFNRIDNERAGRSTDYAKDADRTLNQYDRGFAERSAEAGALIAQDGALGGGSDGYELGQAKTEQEAGTILSQTLLERGGAVNDISKAHNAVGRVRAKRAGSAFGPDGALGAEVVAKQDSWDRGNLDHRDQTQFLHRNHDVFKDVRKQKSLAAVDLKAYVGEGIPGDLCNLDRDARAAENQERIIERDAGDRLISNSESETLQTFDIGGRTVISDAGMAIGIPVVN